MRNPAVWISGRAYGPRGGWDKRLTLWWWTLTRWILLSCFTNSIGTESGTPLTGGSPASSPAGGCGRRRQSGCIPLHSGVPQGSVTEPALLVIHINDLAMRVSSRTHLLADKTIRYRVITASEDRNSASWSPEARRVDMRFHPDKWSVLTVASRLLAGTNPSSTIKCWRTSL